MIEIVNEAQLRSLIAKRGLIETASFDAKRALGSNSKEIAKDISAMSTDGGAILYGVGEDENGYPTILSPFPLAGEPERIANIVETCVSEPPTIEIRRIASEDDPDNGYLLILIPPSPRAPHMVVVGNDCRYYGRDDKGNRRLSQGDVARLYERRDRLREDQDGNLSAFIDQVGLEPPSEEAGHFYVIVEPLFTSRDFIRSIASDGRPQAVLESALRNSRQDQVFKDDDFSAVSQCYWYDSTDGWVGYMGTSARELRARQSAEVLDFFVSERGAVKLVYGGAVRSMGEHPRVLFERKIGEILVRALYFAAGIYQGGKYLGPIDISIALTGLEGAHAFGMLNNVFGHRSVALTQSEYRRHLRTQGHLLLRTYKDDARDLLNPLIRGMTQAPVNFF